MNNLLTLITFLPLSGALILVAFLRGHDEMARLNATRRAPTVLPSNRRRWRETRGTRSVVATYTILQSRNSDARSMSA